MVGCREIQNIVEFFRRSLLRAIIFKRRFVRPGRMTYLDILVRLLLSLLGLLVRIVLPLVFRLPFFLLGRQFFLIGFESGPHLRNHGKGVVNLLLQIAVFVFEFVALRRQLDYRPLGIVVKG